MGIKYGEILRCWPAARSRPASTTSAIFPIPAPAPSCCKRSAVLQLPGLLLNGAVLQQLRGVGRPLSSVRLSPAPVPCGRGQPSHGALCRCGRGRPSPGADVAGMVHTDAHAGAFSCLVAHLTWAPSAFPISPVPLTPMHTYAHSHLGARLARAAHVGTIGERPLIRVQAELPRHWMCLRPWGGRVRWLGYVWGATARIGSAGIRISMEDRSPACTNTHAHACSRTPTPTHAPTHPPTHTQT